jgi:translation initiation factor IF-2
MKKIRINELARELEVKAHEILDRLPELGVAEKKTHSSSIDEDVAIKLRRLYGFDVPDLGTRNGAGDAAMEETDEAPEPVAEAPAVSHAAHAKPEAVATEEAAPAAATGGAPPPWKRLGPLRESPRPFGRRWRDGPFIRRCWDTALCAAAGTAPAVPDTAGSGLARSDSAPRSALRQPCTRPPPQPPPRRWP